MFDDPSSKSPTDRTRFDEVVCTLRLLAAVLVGLFLLGSIFIVPTVLWAGYELYQIHALDRRTPIVAGSSGQTGAEAERAFAIRVAEAFRVGSLASRMQDELGMQGFTVTRSYEGFEHALQIEYASFPCRLTWNVSWTADAAGAIAIIKGSRNAICW